MKILAISDIPSKGLERIAEESPSELKNLNVIISCGDLDKQYIEFLVDGLNKDLFFVCGNHDIEFGKIYDEKDDIWNDEPNYSIAGKYDLHGKIEHYKNYYLVGFGGCLWYGGNSNEYKENEMAKIVAKVKRKLKWNQIKDKLAGRAKKDLIVISHAPVYRVHDTHDTTHTGFKCFGDFIKNVSPLLWIHGHVHLDDVHKNQVTFIDKTTVVNAYCYKYINIKPQEIKISYRPGILDTL
ncbi:MAG: metallophosphoesterase [Elusimicrobia bacterium]|nr:metallophosphoesterase [Candidatus Liberimonas magnetica]